MIKEKEIEKMVKKANYFHVDDFLRDCKDYINAIREKRMIVNICSVSRSGMSRKMKFLSCEQGNANYHYRNYYAFFTALGYSFRSNSDCFIVSGGGMDMVFSVNYNTMHTLHRLGIIDKKECDYLAQQTPTVI